MNEEEIRITLSVNATSPEEVTRTVEVLGRALAGLALEGVEAVLLVSIGEEEYETRESND